MGALEGKAVIVTGAGRGLGRAYAMAMAAEGARLLINDVDVEEAEGVAREIREVGGTAAADGGSVARWDEARGVVEHCVDEYGALDVLVSNAGLYRVAPIWEAKEEELDAIIGVNVKGVFAMARHAVDVMIPQGRGCILNVTSGAQAGLEGRSIYSASKAGVAGLTYTMALDLAQHGIRVNGISPLARTRMSDMSVKGGYPTTANVPPETIAPLVVFLASDAAANVTGQIVRLQGKHAEPVLPPQAGASGHPRRRVGRPRPGGVLREHPGAAPRTHRDRRRDLRVLRRRRGRRGANVERRPCASCACRRRSRGA